MTRWPLASFSDVVDAKGSGTLGLPQSEWTARGKYPVIGQGSEYIEGWTDRDHLVITPAPAVVLYGGHTRRAKFVDQQFVPGPNVKLLQPLKGLDAKFLYYFLNQLPIASRGYADHFPEVRRSPIPVPPLAEQRRIAAVLDKADELRARRCAVLAQLDALAQSMFLDMFGDPVTNPKGWPRRRLADVGSLDRGISKHRPRNAPALLNGPYPLIQTGDIANCDGYVRGYSATYSQFGLKQSKLWPAGTLCITIAANIAKTGVLMFDACFPDSVVGFTCEEPATNEYVRVWLSFLQSALEHSAPESAQKNINLAILRGLALPYADISLQRNFADRIRSGERMRQLVVRSNNELDALFASLQHRAFRGEL